MTCVRDHIHPTEAISGLAQSLNGLLSALWVHPVVITVWHMRKNLAIAINEYDTYKRRLLGSSARQHGQRVDVGHVRPERVDALRNMLSQSISVAEERHIRTDTVLARTLGKRNVHDVVVHRPGILVTQTDEAS